MYNIYKDLSTGNITLSDSWVIGTTGADAPPSLYKKYEEFVFSYVDLSSMEALKSFTYSCVGAAENRYLTTQYRISRNRTKWTEWLDLHTNIDNFPPFTSTDTMYLDIKFVRVGSSKNGVIILTGYTINGSVTKNIVDGNSVITALPGKMIVVKPPFILKVFKINDIEILSNSDLSNVSIKYRYSQDYGRSVSDWEPFTKSNITSANITPIRFFQIEYLILSNATSPIKIYDINLIGDFQNITMDYFKSNLYGVRENCNSLSLCVTNDTTSLNNSTGMPMVSPVTTPSVLPQLTDSKISDLFNPYQNQQALNLLTKLSADTTQMFGHDVIYFITDPDKKGIDYTFHEYQLLNYVCSETIKVSVKDNQFPDNQIQIGQYDMSLFEVFPIDITKDVFKKAFGSEKRPGKDDILFFCKLNRMFIVEHAQPFRDFNNNAVYYKVYLKKYNQKANIIASSSDVADSLNKLTRNSTLNELFGLNMADDKNSGSNSEQMKPLTHDTLRVEISADIENEEIFNAENIISSSNYSLFSVPFLSDAVIYRNMKTYFKDSDNVGFMCWFNINNYTVNDTYNFFNYFNENDSMGLDLNLNADNISVKINNDVYNFPLGVTGSAIALNEETWYSYVLNINQRQRKIEQYIYKRDVVDEEDAGYLKSTKLKLVFNNSQDFTETELFIENTSAKLLGSDMKITNIRLFDDIIPISTHNKILNQSVIGPDTKHLIFADNANKKLVLPYLPLSNTPPGLT